VLLGIGSLAAMLLLVQGQKIIFLQITGALARKHSFNALQSLMKPPGITSLPRPTGSTNRLRLILVPDQTVKMAKARWVYSAPTLLTSLVHHLSKHCICCSFCPLIKIQVIYAKALASCDFSRYAVGIRDFCYTFTRPHYLPFACCPLCLVPFLHHSYTKYSFVP
jgi:hypothetical protein